jgi:DNA-binding winged helix-turn-helix (wHTH) protein/tetratricopeptide (TPR) repeat protein
VPRWLTVEAGAVDLVRGMLHGPGAAVRLSTRERLLLEYLAARPGQAVPREELLTEVWEHAPDSLSRAVDKTMNRLRRKLERDPAQPVHLLTSYGEGYTFVPLAPESGPQAHEPPVDLDPMVGREALLADLAAAFEGGVRLLSLHGPGGIGKSRLARQCARDHGARTGAQVVWLACGGLATVEALWAALAAQQGVRQEEPGPETLGRVFAQGGRVLLVLDEVEALAGSLGPTLETWLGAAPALQVLLTTRRVLGLAGETVRAVPPLAEHEAQELLRQRAAARGTVLDGAPAPGLLAVLGGSPLAIEVAAARLEVLGAAEQLDPQVLLHLDPPARAERSLAAVLDRSWAALAAPARRDLVALAAAPASVDHAAAAALLGGDPARTAQRLGRLQDHALLRTVRRGGGWRLQLDTLVRSHAVTAAREDSDMHDVLKNAELAHQAHFLALGERAVAEGARAATPALLRAFAQEHEHFAALRDRCTDRDPAAAARAALLIHPATVLLVPSATVAAQVALAVDQATKAGEPALLARAQVAQARVLHGRRDGPGVRQLIDTVLAADGVGPLIQAEACWVGLVSAARERDGTRARALGSQARTLLEAATAADREQAALLALWLRDAEAFAQLIQGQVPQARRALEDLLPAVRAAGDRALLALCLVHLAICLRRSDRYAAAHEHEAEAIACSRWLGAPAAAAIQQGNAALNLVVMGKTAAAERDLRAAIADLQRAGLESHTIAPELNLGNLLRDSGRREDAAAHLTRAAALARRWNRPRTVAIALSELAQVHWMQGRHTAALAELEEARAEAARAPGPSELPALLDLQRAGLLADRGDRAEAEALRRAAAEEAPAGPVGALARDCAAAWCALAAAREAGTDAALAEVRATVAALPRPPWDFRSWADHLRTAVGLPPHRYGEG